MFSEKKRLREELEKRDADLARLKEYMEAFGSGQFENAGEEEFNDPTLAKLYNELLDKSMDRNNRMTARLNDAMNRIGDSEPVKNMLDEVESQTATIGAMRDSGSDLGSSIANIQSSASNIRDSSHLIIDSARECMDKMDESMKLVDHGAVSIGSISQEMAGFREKTKKITEIIDQVRRLAEDSSLLGLNASIEAARAGEAGRGFAVVAEQMNQLSNNTADCADDVVRYVGELIEGIENLVKSVDLTMEDLNKGNESVHESIEVIRGMNEQLEGINGDIDRINVEIDTQSDVTERFIDGVKTMADSYETLSNECITVGERFYRISRDIDSARGEMFRKNSRPTLLDTLKVYDTDHLIFTWRIYNHIAGFEVLKLEQVNNPTKCKVGLWFGKQTDPVITGSAGFKKAFDWHQKLHSYAVSSWQAAQDHNREEAMQFFYQALDAYKEYSDGIHMLANSLKAAGITDETPIWVYQGP